MKKMATVPLKLFPSLFVLNDPALIQAMDCISDRIWKNCKVKRYSNGYLITFWDNDYDSFVVICRDLLEARGVFFIPFY
jgi:hypothetical protein